MIHDPTFSFTVPSIYDDIPLDCRIYNPPHSILSSQNSPWHPRGAIIAHPYAPLGGCFDDPVVVSVAEKILREGGAGGSKGRTSWQAKAEVEDYISFAGFFVYYLEGIRNCIACLQSSVTLDSSLLSVPSSPSVSNIGSTHGDAQEMTLLLGGYSYGALIVTLLPPTPSILNRFETPSKGTAISGIKLRATSIAAQWSKDVALYLQAEKARKSKSHESLRPSAGAMAMAMGGDESEHPSKRPSHEGKRSIDAIRRSIDRLPQKLRSRQHSHSSVASSSGTATEENSTATSTTTTPEPRTCYLLISPPLPPVSIFLSMHSRPASECEHKLVSNETLAVYGDSDFFTSQKKYRRWAEGIEGLEGSRFRGMEVEGAGHFWREDGAAQEMGRRIREWVKRLEGDSRAESR